MVKRIGEILRELLPIGEKEIDAGLALQKEKGGRLGETLVKMKAIKEPELLRALSLQLRIPYLQNLPEDEIDRKVVSSVPIGFLKKYAILPYQRTGSSVKAAVSDPLNFTPVDDLKILFGCEVEVFLADPILILNAINLVYDTHAETAEQVVENLSDEEGAALGAGLDEPIDLIDVVDDAPIIKLVNSLMFRAAKDRASDIHYEPFEREIAVRFRIDGVLHNIITLPKRFQPSVVSRIKIMASMNIAEKRLPQDGRIRIKLAGRDIDIRVSVIPTAFGERIVLRLLDRSGYLLKLRDVGMAGGTLSGFEKLIHMTHGIILVTGPTGSGKTTTLYACLSEINVPGKNIITIEDPVEYQIRGIGQMQINPKIELTFAAGLRSILRQDPDVIMVGEIRDVETAEIAIQASLTGHLVFSTLHTNDSAGAATRLIDMGVEPFLVASSVLAVVAQRLVRLLCPVCKREHALTRPEAEELGVDVQTMAGRIIYEPVGCERCMNTGYRGRTGIYELLLMKDNIRDLVMRNMDSITIKNKSVENGMSTLREDGAVKILEGLTSLEEVLRVTQEELREI
jgi:general secretion pathway protein E